MGERYADGTRKVPRLGTFCDPATGTPDHRICGGWWCTCHCHDNWDIGESGGHIRPHVGHEWQQVDHCVYCKPCGVRLYQGELATAEEQEPMAALFDGVHEKVAADWRHMREQVLSARGERS